MKHRRRSLAVRQNESPLSLAWIVISNIATLMFRYLMAIRYLNPVTLIREKQQRIYYTDASNKVPFYPRWSERLINLLISDKRRRRNILNWVQRQLPKHNVTNFTSSWHDGITLCSLLEVLQPGVCPGSGHLKHHNRVNNCRLGIRLATQSLGLPQGMILPEEMAIADRLTEPKILKYVSMIKWAAENKAFTNKTKTETRTKKIASCVARGSGLEAGIIGKKMRFTLVVADVVGMFHLNIDIKGPKNEIYNETIISLRQSSDLHKENSSTAVIKDRNPNPSIDERVMEFIEDGFGNSYVRWKNIKHFDETAVYDAIPFQCLCNGENTFLMGYTPGSAGIHTVSIRWQNGHINGSPFKVKVYQPLDTRRRSVKDPTDNVLAFGTFSLSSIEEKAGGSIDMVEEEKFSRDCNGQSDDCRKPHRSQRLSTKFRKEFTVTKRRVKRKVVSRNGEEIVIYESPSPTLSRQSSMTDSSTEDENRRRSRSGSPPSRSFVSQGRLSAEKWSKISTTDTDILNDAHLRQTPQTSRISGFLTNNESERFGTFRIIKEDKKSEKPITTEEESSRGLSNTLANAVLQRSVSDCALTNPINSALLKRKAKYLKETAKCKQRGNVSNSNHKIPDDMNDEAMCFSSNMMDNTILNITESRNLERSWCEINDRSLCNTLSSVSSTSSTTSNSSLEYKHKTPLCGVHSLPSLSDFADSEQHNMLRMKKMLRKNPIVVDSTRRRSRDRSGQKYALTEGALTKSSYEHTKDQPQKEIITITRRQNDVRMQSPNRTSPAPEVMFPISNRAEMQNQPYITGDSEDTQIHQVEPIQDEKEGNFSFDKEDRINNLQGLPGYPPGNRRCRRRESMLKWIEDQTMTTGGGFVNDESALSCEQIEKSNVLQPKDYKEPAKEASVYESVQMMKHEQTVGKVNKVHFDESKFCTKTIDCSFLSFDGIETPLRKGGLQRQMSIRSLDSRTSLSGTSCQDKKEFQSISTNLSEEKRRADQMTQVFANEILQETKYLSFLCDLNVKRRKNCLKLPLQGERKTNSPKQSFRPRSLSSGTTHEHLFEYRRRFIQGDCTNLGSFSDYGFDGSVRYEQDNENVNYPMRQSTVDTIDSGIADEMSTKTIKTSPSPLVDEEQRSLNRHQKLFRKPYRGNIFLDPKLVMSNSNRNSPCSDKECPDDHSFESSIERSSFEHGGSSRKLRKRSDKQDQNEDFTSLSDSEVTNASKSKCFISKYLSPTITKQKENTMAELSEPPIEIKEIPKMQHTSKYGKLCTTCSRDDAIYESKSNSSTDESGTLYGISTNSRSTLLDNLANFRNLVVSPFRALDGEISSEFQTPLNSPRFNSENISTCELNNKTFSSEITRIIKPVLFSFTNASSVTRFDEIKPGHYVSSIENMFIPISVASTKSSSGSSCIEVSSNSSSGQKNICEQNLSIQSLDSRMSSPFSQGSKIGTLSDSSLFSDIEKDDVYFDKNFKSNETDNSDEENNECKAEGLGLTQGQVGVKNNFQVWVESSRNSCLAVSIHGPRPHTVLESSVVYTGDNLYEVVFEVSHPGYYVICLRWAGKEIQDSPYLCRVTY